MAYISANELVSVVPSVLQAGGDGTTLNGLLLVNDTRFPIGDVISFSSWAALEAYAGAGSEVAAAGAVYFGGFNLCQQYPSALLVAQYPSSAVPAWLRGGSVSSLTLAELQALSGTISVTVDGTTETSANISLDAATSFSNAATLIQAGFTTPNFTVTYDSVSGGFLFTNTVTGSTSTISYASGALANSLNLTQANAAVISQGADVAVPGTFMSSIIAQTADFATFGHLFNPDATGNANKVAFALWTSQQKNRYAYVPWDADPNAAVADNITNLGYIVTSNSYSGTAPVWEGTGGTRLYLDMFIMSIAASIDTSVANGSTDFAFRSQSGLTASVTDAGTASNLIANGYNFYGAYAASGQTGIFLYPGSISGPFTWIDQYIEQIWMNSYLQQTLFTLLQDVKKIPFNQTGAGLIESALVGTVQAPGPIDQALSFGSIQSGVTLSSSQVVAVNQATATTDAATTLMANGWYLQVSVPPAAIRVARGPWPILFYYTSGGSVHTITLSSTLVA